MSVTLLSRPAARWAAITLVVLVISATAAALTFRGIVSDGEDVSAAYAALSTMSEFVLRNSEADAAQRVYALTRSDDDLEAHRRALSLAAAALDEARLQRGVSRLADPELARLRERLSERMTLARELTDSHRSRVSDRQRDGALVERARLVSADIRSASAAVQHSMRGILDGRLAGIERGIAAMLVVGVLTLASSFALVFALIHFFNRELRRRGDLERQMQDVNADLTSTVRELQQLSREKNQIAAMADLLQSCRTAEEAYSVISRALMRLLPGSSGAIGTMKSSSNLVEMVLTWGDQPPTQAVFSPDDCWALRRGRAHAEYDAASDVRCAHILPDAAGASLCLPLIAQGEALGVLYLNLPDGSVLSDDVADLTLTLSEQISMALANLRLQEMLRMQSIVDPLSGVFNRRYMETTLERELLRAKRDSRPLAIIMFDLDHFKRFNDQFGHDAGDSLLRAFGGLLRTLVRGDDVACRYGGEEFVLIMPGAPESIAAERASQLREAVAALDLQHRGRRLGNITISCGVSVFPAHGVTVDALLSAADAALYEAKRGGRNRVLVAPSLRLAAVAG